MAAAYARGMLFRPLMLTSEGRTVRTLWDVYANLVGT
jgi:hypothetical protein